MKSGDRLEIQHEPLSFYESAHSWLVQQGIMVLNSPGREAEAAYRYVVEILNRQEAADTVLHLLRAVGPTDTTVRWSLLYLLGDIGDRKAADWLAGFCLESLPARGEGCEGPRDSELLLRTMAIESLKKTAGRHQETGSHFLKIIGARPDRAVLIEAVKAAAGLGLKDQVAELLPEEDRWILEIGSRRVEEMHADPEREDARERSFTPPKFSADATSPSVACGTAHFKTQKMNHHG